jgi:hypothetical protein
MSAQAQATIVRLDGREYTTAAAAWREFCRPADWRLDSVATVVELQRFTLPTAGARACLPFNGEVR